MLKMDKKLNYKVLFSFVVLTLLVLIFSFIKTKDIYDIRISIKLDYFSVQNMDNIFALNLTKEFLNIKGVEKCFAISTKNQCSLYLKLRLLSFKYKTIQKIKTALDDYISKIKLYPEISFETEFNKKYDIFLIFYLSEYDNQILSDKFNMICTKLANLNLIDKVLEFQKDNIYDYVYFKDSDLITYDITPSEIKELIKQNNINITSSIQENSYSYTTNLNSSISNISDLENIPIYYQNKDFSDNFKNVFKIKRNIISSVFYNNNNVKLFAIRKNPFVPLFAAELMIKNELKKIEDLKKFNYELIKTNNLSKGEIKLTDNPNKTAIRDYISVISKDFKHAFYFIKTDSPMVKNQSNFIEESKDKIVILTSENQKLRKLKTADNKPKTEKEMAIDYSYDEININNYFFNKKELAENIVANQEGLICDYYFKNSNKIKIVLKNNKDSNFIYSKKYKKLIDVDLFLNKSLIQNYVQIVRLNGNKI